MLSFLRFFIALSLVGSCTLRIPKEPVCGIFTTNVGEECDDGNTLGGDGCRADCAGTEVCGDGLADLDAGEACDDANAINGDGCEIDCSLSCGNGVVDIAEVCDDGNNTDGDGCRGDCLKIEVCGDNVVDAGELCDDGNTASGDGCRADCQSLQVCGDGVVEPLFDTIVDLRFEYLATDCQALDVDPLVVEVNERPFVTPNINTLCSINGQSFCAIGVETFSPGAQAQALLQSGLNRFSLSAQDIADVNNRLGWVVVVLERTDFPPLEFVLFDEGGGQSAENREPDICVADSRSAANLLTETLVNISLGEDCEDGNLNNDDGCDNNCTNTACGNGIQTSDEECDDGGGNSDARPDACRTDCSLPVCGDGVTDPSNGEQCDDGNNINNDGCRNTCTP